MKNRIAVKSHPGFKGGEQVPVSKANPTNKKPEIKALFKGLTQENYVNPQFLGLNMVVSITSMNFGGLWL